MRIQSPVAGVEKLAGNALGALSGAATKVRRPKPLHAQGVLLEARIRRTGAPGWAVPWLTDAGEERGVVRLSRSLGLPSRLPDVLGLALRWHDEQGTAHDLLLASTPLSPGARHLMLPRRDYGSAAYTSLLPYRAGTQLVVLAALPLAAEGAPRTEEDLTEVTAEAPVEWSLSVAALTGPWQEFGRLSVGPLVPDEIDPPLRLDAVLNPPPGLTVPAGHRLLREPAYARARAAS